jgi:small GTP-binding protein
MRESQSTINNQQSTIESPHPAFKLRHTLRHTTLEGYESIVNRMLLSPDGRMALTPDGRMALSPDGRILASPSADRTVKLWDINNGKLLRMFEGHWSACLAWSPSGQILASGSYDKTICLWHTGTGNMLRILKGHIKGVNDIAWSLDGKVLASGSEDETICFWSTKTGEVLQTLKVHAFPVNYVAWSPDGRIFCSGSCDGKVRLWDAKIGKKIQVLKLRSNVRKNNIAWSPNGQLIALSDDRIIRIWNTKTKCQTNILEAHTNRIVSVSFFGNSRLFGSLSENGTVVIWRTDTWIEVAHIDKIGEANEFSHLIFHPSLSVMVAPGDKGKETITQKGSGTWKIYEKNINVWDSDFNILLSKTSSTLTMQYVNAKAVLVGDSGVGKSGLGIRIAEREFQKTESTHGAQFWQIPVPKGVIRDEKLPNVQAELTLWDLAGQPEYRLVHQLFLDDTDIALLLFDCSDPNDPFRGVPYWAKVLKKHAPEHARKFLVSARCDVSPVTVDQQQIKQTLAKYGFDLYFKTSAKKGDGVESLLQNVLEQIPWDKLPRTTTPRLFQIIREFLLELKEAGETVILMDFVEIEVTQRYPEHRVTEAEIDTVIALLQAQGLVYRLEDIRIEMPLILMKPEIINQYSSSIIQAARNHPLGIGAVSERDVLIGDLSFTEFERLSREQEIVVLEATTELLIRHDLCFREMGLLVFPSQISGTRPAPEETHPRTEVAYRFSGGIETIYASLVVRLSYTEYFRREDQWKYAVEFSRDGQRLGFSMQQIEEGTGELEIYFYPGINEFDRVTFIRFITDHLRAKGIDIKEQIRLYCPNCDEEVKNRKAIEMRVNAGQLDIPCQFCGTSIMIPKSIEERYQRDRILVEKQQELTQTVEQRTKREVKEFKEDQRQYIQEEQEYMIHILHLSDIHLENSSQARKYRAQVETDLLKELEVKRLEYLVISGDIANYSSEEEYKAAFEMIDSLVKRFGLDAGRVVIVPGNHDLNWDFSEEAYPFVPKRKLKEPLDEERSILAGDAGALVRDDNLYKQRFANFNMHFWKKVYSGKEYPLDYAEQVMFIERPDDRILFLGLNSCWQIDHHFRQRAGINMEALSNALDQLQDEKYDGWLKIAVWHHPVTGKEMMNNEFLQLLTVHGFQICMHGHIHEAQEGFYKYDASRSLHIIGAGTFGAPAKEQVTGIPLQYNLLTLDPEAKTITVNTRKKEKPDGAWSADARWGNKNDPKPRYTIKLKNYKD